MKKIYKIIFVAFLAVSFSACEDIDKDPFEVNGIDGPFGSFVRLDITTSPVLDVTDIENTVFGGTLSVPTNNVASYEIKVRRVSGGVASDYAPFLSVNSFPAEFMVNAANLSTTLGLAIPDLLPGDRFDFEATSVGTDGTVVTFDDFGPNLQGNPAQAQSYRFNTFISCPFVLEEALGTYQTVVASLPSRFPAGNNFEVIAGENSGQIIMINPFSSPDPDSAGYEIEVDVNPFGLAIVPDQQFIFDTDAAGFAGFTDTWTDSGAGFVFSCSGTIVLSWSLDLGVAGSGFDGGFSWGTQSYQAQKL